MNCPPAIANILLRILQVAVLRIRAAGWSGDSQRCAIEADHIHNLPALLGDYSEESLHFYWEVERLTFRAQSTEEHLSELERLWGELQPHVSAIQGAPSPTGGRQETPITAG